MGASVLRPSAQVAHRTPIAVPQDGIPRSFDLGFEDLDAAFFAGLDDFRAAPRCGLLFGGAYVLTGLAIMAVLLYTEQLFLLFPALAGFLLVGPFLAVGLYEISRRRALGLPVARKPVILAFNRHGGTQIGILGLALITGATIWMKLAVLLYALFFGMSSIPMDEMIQTVLSTSNGIEFALIGSAIGFVMAATVFTTCIFALPMLLDRDIDVITAVIASCRAVARQPRLYIGWAMMIAMLAGIGLVTVVGLPFVMPILGHATWHLYTSAFGQSEAVD